MYSLRLCVFILVVWFVPSIKASDVESAKETRAKSPPDKSVYYLFRPVPSELMREMSTDRPDLTESPYTLDAGHFQIETDVVAFSRDAESHTKSLSVLTTNFKMGLTNRIDLQFVLEPYNYSKSYERDAAGVRFTETAEGFGDITSRLKINFWGNDDGKSAFGIMPFIKVPTNQNQLGNTSVEGGVILPFAYQLPKDWNLGAMLEFDCLQDSDHRGHHAEIIQTITFGHDIIGDLGGYVEFYSNISTEKKSQWAASVNAGLTYGLTKNIQFDIGVNVGVTPAADDVNPFIGLSMRF